MKYWMFGVLGAAGLVLLAAGGCMATEPAAPISLDGTAWVLARMPGRTLVDPEGVSLQFAGERVTGSAGCNRFSASFTVDGNSLTFGTAAATRMMCVAPGVMEQEQAFLDALGKVTTMRMDGDRLELRGTDGALVAELQRMEGEP